MEQSATADQRHEPWNKGKLVGQKSLLKLKEIWAIRIRLQIANRIRELALFDLAIDSKLRACDLLRLRVRDVAHGERVAARAIVMQQKTQPPVQFQITEQTREAVVGREFGRAVMEQLVPTRTGMADALDTLMRQDLVQPVRVVPEPTWIFKHVLVQEVVYETLLLQQRRDLHGRVGAILEDLHSSRLEEHYEALAHHYLLSDRQDNAVEYLERAGDKAARYFSLREARSQFQRAVRLLDLPDMDLATRGRFADLAVKWAEVSVYSASPENVQALDRTLLHARSVHDHNLETSTLYWIGRTHYGVGEMNRATAVLRECEARLASDPDGDLLARSRIVLSTLCMYRGEIEAAIDVVRKTIPALQSSSEIEQVAYGEGLLGLYCGLEGRFAEGARALDRALALAFQTQNKTRVAMTNVYAAVAQAHAGELDSAIHSASEAACLGVQIEIPVGAGIALGIKGYALFLAGQRDAGIRATQEGLRTLRATQSALAMSITLGWLAEEHALLGDANEARLAAEEFMKLYEVGNWWGLIPTLRACGIVAAREGDPDWERHFEQAIRQSEEHLTRPDTAIAHFRRAEILSNRSMPERARVSLERARVRCRGVIRVGTGSAACSHRGEPRAGARWDRREVQMLDRRQS